MVNLLVCHRTFSHYYWCKQVKINARVSDDLLGNRAVCTVILRIIYNPGV